MALEQFFNLLESQKFDSVLPLYLIIFFIFLYFKLSCLHINSCKNCVTDLVLNLRNILKIKNAVLIK